MDFMIMDNAGNAVEAFSDEWEAITALALMAREDGDAATSLAVLAFDPEGEAVGEPITVADVVPELAMHVSLIASLSVTLLATNALTFRGESATTTWRPSTSRNAKLVPAC